MVRLYFDDFAIGRKLSTKNRTLAAADIDSFAALSGDHNPIHTDANFAAESQFGQRIAHGLLIQSIATGLVMQLGILNETIVAFREMSVKFSAPVFIGESVKVELEVVEKKEMRRLNVGNVLVKFRVIKQNDTIVQRGTWRLLIKLRPTT